MAQPDRKRENPALLEDERRPPNAAEAGIGADPSDVRPAGDRSNVNDAGSDATDTPDGPAQSEEVVRQVAEDIPTGGSPQGPEDTVPVFERAPLPPEP